MDLRQLCLELLDLRILRRQLRDELVSRSHLVLLLLRVEDGDAKPPRLVVLRLAGLRQALVAAEAELREQRTPRCRVGLRLRLGLPLGLRLRLRLEVSGVECRDRSDERLQQSTNASADERSKRKWVSLCSHRRVDAL